MLRIEVDETPIPQPRPRVNAKGGVYYPGRSVAYKKEVHLEGQLAMIQANAQPIEGAVYAMLQFYKDAPLLGARYGDVDNLTKIVLDALEGVCYANDRQVQTVLAQKLPPAEGGGNRLVVQLTDDAAEFRTLVMTHYLAEAGVREV